MSIVIFDYTDGAPTSVRIPQTEVMATHPKTGNLKHIGYFRGQNSIFIEDIGNKDLKPNKVPDFVFNPERNKCELRFDDRDARLLEYIESHSWFINGKYEKYSEEIENKKKLGNAESVEKALDYVKESDDMKIRALGMAVVGVESYGKTPGTIKAILKDKAIKSPKEIIKACEDELFENRFVASLALASGIVKINNTMTAIVWGDNNGTILRIATGEDFITKLAKHISEKTSESQALLQEIGSRLNLTKEKRESENKEANELASLKKRLEEAELGLEIANNKLKKVTSEKEDADLIELREKYTSVTGKNLSIRFQNDTEWMKEKIQEKIDEDLVSS